MNIIKEKGLPIKSWATDIEDGALAQDINVSQLPFVQKWVALMPDVHVGYGVPIGCVFGAQDVIVPNAVGVDIGCGMVAVKTSLSEISTEDLKVIMGGIREVIPLGFEHQKDPQDWSGFGEAPDTEVIQRELESARKQIGTLGGGNHFIEIQEGDDGAIWLMIHSGSRNIGLQVAEFYHKRAQHLCERWQADLPNKDLAFLPMDTDEGRDYFEAMTFCLDFAQANRRLMMQRVGDVVMAYVGGMPTFDIDIHHNYAEYRRIGDQDLIIHRKGATDASKNRVGIIPGSMGSRSYITEGLGNAESFYSCSHGAGRRMGRGQAKRTLVLADEQAKMKSVVHGLRGVSDLDEAPGAYKDIDEVMEQQEDLVTTLVALRPLANIKG